jgi:putative colanic acid biosynthesis glycosyltransferase
MFLSIVTVCRNNLAGLLQTQASVEIQGSQDFEWLVIDGASDDGTVLHLENTLYPRLNWISEPDKGIYDAMNKGTSMSLGEYVIYLNAGDSFTAYDCVQRLKDAVAQDGDPDLVYGACAREFADGSKLIRKPRLIEVAIRHTVPAIHQATLFRRAFLEMPPYSLRYRLCADYYISAVAYRKNPRVLYLPWAMATFSVGGESMTRIWLGLTDCWKIQRDVLGLGLISRIYSASRRLLNNRLLYLFHLSTFRTRNSDRIDDVI